jgi:hypothetical protein
MDPESGERFMVRMYCSEFAFGLEILDSCSSSSAIEIGNASFVLPLAYYDRFLKYMFRTVH